MNEIEIPKIIHYCWFGKNKKPKYFQKCIKSWQKFCPEYKLIEWNETSFDIGCCMYVKQAYENKKWAFVSDYVRFQALNQYGGIYVDTDVEVIKPIDRLRKTNFLGFEDADLVNSGLIMGCAGNDWLCREMLRGYENSTFVLPDGGLNYYDVCQRMTDILLKYGLVLNNKKQEINGYTVYPTEYFNPLGYKKNGKITENSYSIHHYAASWKPLGFRMKLVLVRALGPNWTNRLIQFKKKLIK